MNGVAIDWGSNLSYARLCTIAVSNKSTRASVTGVNGVHTGGAVDGLSSCVYSNLLNVSGHSGVKVSHLFNFNITGMNVFSDG